MHGIIRAIAKDLHPLLNTILFKNAIKTSINRPIPKKYSITIPANVRLEGPIISIPFNISLLNDFVCNCKLNLLPNYPIQIL